MRKLILHIGAHKTGTTAIQFFLHQQSDRLLAKGWELLSVNGVVNLGNCVSFDWDRDRVHFGFRPALYEKLIRRVTATHRNCIISAEDFFFINDESWIARLAADLRSQFSDVSLVIYLRNQVDMAISNKAQGAKTPQSSMIFGNSEAILPELDEHVFEYLDYYSKVALWRTHFPDCRLVLRDYFREKLVNGDAVFDFAEATRLGVSPKGTIKANETTGSKLTALLHKLRRAGASAEMILEALREGHFQDVGGVKNKPARGVAMEFFAQFRQSNQSLKNVYGLELGFDEDAYPESEERQESDLCYEVEALVKMVAVLSSNWDPRFVDDLRDAAIALEGRDLELSYRLLLTARRFRPLGPFIQRKIGELEARLKRQG